MRTLLAASFVLLLCVLQAFTLQSLHADNSAPSPVTAESVNHGSAGAVRGNSPDTNVITSLTSPVSHSPDLGAPLGMPLSTDVGGAITTDTTWTLASSPYIVTSDVTVQSGVMLTVEAGVEVRFNNSTGLFVHGALSATGMVTQPITLTSSSATPAPGQWKGIFFEDASDDARNLLEYVTVSYAGQAACWSPSCPNFHAGIGVYNASPTIRHTTVRQSAGDGLWAGNASLSLNQDTFEQNGSAGIRLQNSNATVENCSITGNAGLAIENVSASLIIRARLNWWGHPSGPYHPVTNPNGLGSPVSDNVVYDPWLVSAVARQAASLTLGQQVTDSVSLLGYKDYQWTATTGLSLLVEVTPLSGSQSLWVYSRFGGLPLWTLYDLRVQDKTPRGTFELLLSPTQSGTYYFSIYGSDVTGTGGNYRIVANTITRRLSDVSPQSAGNAGEVTVNLTGMPFAEGMGVQLRATGRPTIAASSVTVASPTTLWARFGMTGTTTGVYDVYATWSGGGEVGLTNAFTVTQSTGAKLDARLIAPAVRPGREYTLWLEYGNTGTADMPAPMFIITSTQHAPMRLSTSEPYTETIQVLGINFNQPAGILYPGAQHRIPIYFQATNTNEVQFNLARMVADSTPIDWNAVEQEVRPPDISSELWNVIWANFKARVGTTWADYLRVMGDQATYLAQYGSATYDVRDLFAAVFGRASGVYLRRTLAGGLDAYSPARGLPLAFARVAFDTLDQRFTVGPFGRTWSHSFEYALTRPDANTAIVKGPGGTARRFTKKQDGTWQASAGDFGALESLTGGAWRLREKDGLTWQFDSAGRLTSVAELNGNSIALTYNGGGKLAALTHSNGQSFTLQYNAQGRISRLTDHAGQVTDYTYDASGEHLTSVVAPGGVTTTYAYTNHALTTITYPDGTHQYYSYDAQGRLASQSRDGNAERVEFTYDALGTVWAKDATNATTTLWLGASSQPLDAQDPLGNRVRLQYDNSFNPTRLTQPSGGASRLAFDNRGNANQVTDSLGHITTMGHTTDLSRLDWLRDANNILTDFTYDSRGNLTRITYADARTESFGYDTNGNVTSVTNRRGETTTFTYNSVGQITRKTWSNGRTMDYTYDARGNLLSANDSVAGAITMQYDTRDFLTRIDYPGGRWFTFEYSNAGRRTRRTGHDGYILNYHYDAAGRLQRLTNGSGTEIVRYEYDANGRLSKETKGNGTYTTYQYDSAGQLLHLINYASGGAIQSRFDYTYDANGNRTSMTTLSGTTTYGYDATGQLVSVTYPGGNRVAYEYDALGNRITVNDNGTVTRYSTNTMNQYTQVGDATYAYDADGNMTSKRDASGTTTYEYDTENRLIRVTAPGSNTWEYTYDALGNRITVNHNGVVTRYVHDPVGLVDVAAEYDGSSALVARYVHGMGLAARVSAAGQSAYYAFDGTGHTRQVTNAAGAIANTYDYDPFGIPLQTSETISNPFLYVGRFGVMVEGNGLSFMRARHYYSGVGRFVQEDPIGISGGINLNMYSTNNPVSFADPDGLKWKRWWLDPARMVFHGCWLGKYRSGCKTTPPGELGDEGVDAEDLPDEASKIHDILFHMGVRGASKIASYWLIFEILRRWEAGEKITFEEYVWSGGFIYFGLGTDVLDQGLVTKVPDQNLKRTTVGSTTTPVIRPVDPNEKAGPPGTGLQQIVTVNDELRYTVYFENVATATAPAQEVFIVDDLDPDLDWQTFRVAEVAFGSQIVSAQESASQFYTRATVPDHRSGVNKNWWVDITTQINYQNGQVNWIFRTLDPETGELPEDALAGFLPPNDASRRGEGHVSFSIKPKSNLSVGTLITNTASIVFDTNAAIATNTVTNTIGTTGYQIFLPITLKSATSSAMPTTGNRVFLPLVTNSASSGIPTTGSQTFLPLVANTGMNTGNITGQVWLDTTKDGIKDASEIDNVAGVTITLKSATGVPEATATTDASGYYTFTGIVPGNYTVVATVPSVYGATAPTIVSVSVRAGSSVAVDFGLWALTPIYLPVIRNE